MKVKNMGKELDGARVRYAIVDVGPAGEGIVDVGTAGLATSRGMESSPGAPGGKEDACCGKCLSASEDAGLGMGCTGNGMGLTAVMAALMPSSGKRGKSLVIRKNADDGFGR